MLEKIKIRASYVVECYDLAVHDGVLRKVAQGIENVLILAIEGLPPSGIETQFAIGIDRER